MTDVLHLPARADAPIVCDMRTASDTPDQRLAEYAALFERALVRRDRPDGAVRFTFRFAPETRALVQDLAHREAACCPFLDYRVESTADEVVYTVTSLATGLDRDAANVTLDAFYALPDHADSGYAGLLARLADGGVHVIDAGTDRWELRESAAG